MSCLSHDFCILFSSSPPFRKTHSRYKPIIVFSAFMGMLLFGLMSWTTSKDVVQLVQMCFGTFMACEVAYYTYIYAKVERSKYQLVTGHTRSAILAGRFVGATIAQLLISFGVINYKELNYISFGCKAYSLSHSISISITPSIHCSVQCESHTICVCVSLTGPFSDSICQPSNKIANRFIRFFSLSYNLAQCISLIFALLLPSVSVSLYFYSNTKAIAGVNTNENGNVNCRISPPHTNGQLLENHVKEMPATLNGSNISTSSSINSSDCDLNNIEKSNSKLSPNIVDNNEHPKFSFKLAIQRIVNHTRTSYSNPTVIQWSILWAMSMCGFLQVRITVFCIHYLLLQSLDLLHCPIQHTN